MHKLNRQKYLDSLRHTSLFRVSSLETKEGDTCGGLRLRSSEFTTRVETVLGKVI
ncbi:MAG: hypothetical protein V7K94_31455 [Nostoc sp.]|uniref:hypothetical protein n=1 Tax=Nostoc sp. TaxID=1180 RepID=UPI002FF518DA